MFSRFSPCIRKQRLLFALGWLVCSSHIARAQPTTGPTPPLQFDRATVQNLVENIDTPRHASWLKALYFSRRRPAPNDLPVGDGWKLLSDASDAEPKGTRRWFLLQSVKAAVAYRKTPAEGEVGAKAYKALFDKAKDAPAVGAEYLVRASINEYLNSLRGVIRDLELHKTREASQAVISAWNAYFVSQTYTDKFSKNVAPTNWIEIFSDISPPYLLVDTLDQQIKDTTTPFYDLLAFDAHLHSELEPNIAIERMEKAKNLLPTWPDGKIKKDEATLYFSRLISYYKRAKQDAKIPAVEKERDEILANSR